MALWPQPVVHVKGWSKCVLLKGAAPPPHALDMRGQAQLPREQSAAEACAACAVRAVKAAAPGTVAWDGDACSADSFTSLIRTLCYQLPGVHLLAFVLDDWVEGFKSTWLPILQALPSETAPSALTLVTVPPPTCPESIASHKYVHLGRAGLVTTGATQIICLGGGHVTAEEARLASGDVPARPFSLIPARRWALPQTGTAAAGTGFPLIMEDSPVAGVAGVVILDP